MGNDENIFYRMISNTGAHSVRLLLMVHSCSGDLICMEKVIRIMWLVNILSIWLDSQSTDTIRTHTIIIIIGSICKLSWLVCLCVCNVLCELNSFTHTENRLKRERFPFRRHNSTLWMQQATQMLPAHHYYNLQHHPKNRNGFEWNAFEWSDKDMQYVRNRLVTSYTVQYRVQHNTAQYGHSRERHIVVKTDCIPFLVPYTDWHNTNSKRTIWWNRLRPLNSNILGSSMREKFQFEIRFYLHYKTASFWNFRTIDLRTDKYRMDFLCKWMQQLVRYGRLQIYLDI